MFDKKERKKKKRRKKRRKEKEIKSREKVYKLGNV